MLHHLKAVVLQSVKYGDSSIIAQVYSDVFGRQSFLIHGVRKKNSKISPYLFQPLSLLDIVGYVKETREIQRIKELKASVTLQHIHFDVRKSSIALFLSEILNKTLREADSNLSLFNYLSNAIQVLDMNEEGIENFHIIFLMQYTKFIGIYPKDNSDHFNLNEKQSVGIFDLIKYSLSDISKIHINNKQRRELLSELLRYYKYHFDGLGTIKSLEVLREIFSN
jgi:DNA repair protein RecO (recombination protein O)